MSQHLVNHYLNDLDRLKKISGSLNEQVVREAFKDLLKAWAKQQGLVFVAEHEYQTKFKTTVYPDGTVLHDIRVPLGYWEAKDSKDDLDEEIAKKTAKGYPQDNIIYENGETAVLIQNKDEILHCSMTEPKDLLRLVGLFFDYERPEIAAFRKAVEQFKADLPAVLAALRERIDSAYAANTDFQKSAQNFLKHAKDTINPSVSEADVREMLIQHIPTEEIFAHVFNDSAFHRENNIAKELYKLEEEFFTGATKKNTLKALEPYYAAIRSNAAVISSHHEKQGFLKAIYENFYKVYNPKAADRLGVVYTPNEIVKFMIEGADWLCHKHFGAAADGYQGVSRYRYTSEGTRIDNITDWGLKQFQAHYASPSPLAGEGAPKGRVRGRAAASGPSSGAARHLLPQGEKEKTIAKDDIFHYVYGVLHDPIYRETYAINLKREFPRIPFHPDFWAWAHWGKQLMACCTSAMRPSSRGRSHATTRPKRKPIPHRS